MAWNKSSENGEAVSRPLQKRKGFRFPVRGAIAGAIVVVGAGIVAWWVMDDKAVPHDEDASGTGRLIREVAPAVVSNRQEAAEVKTNDFCFGKNGKIQVGADGKKWLHGARVYDVQPGDRFDKDGRKLNKPPLFRYKSENLLGGILSHPAGMPVPAAPNRAAKFDEDFMQSLLDHIEIKDTDSPEDRQLKQDVIDAKKEIVQRIKAGETFTSIIEDTQREYNRLANMRDEMRKIYNELKANGASEQELKDHVEAANKLLEKNGVMKLPFGASLKERILKNNQIGK